MRPIDLDELLKFPIRPSPTANDFYGWCKKMFETHTKEEREAMPKDIVTLRRMFYEGYENE